MNTTNSPNNISTTTPESENSTAEGQKSWKKHLLRFMAGTALLSSVATIGTNIIDGPGIKFEFGGHPAGTYEETITTPAWREPGELAKVHEFGPTASLNQSQMYSVDGRAVELNTDQKSELEDYINQLDEKIKQSESDGNKVTEVNVRVIGNASDEHLGENLPKANLGQDSDMNDNLAKERANIVAEELTRLATTRGINLTTTSFGIEHTLVDDDVSKIEEIASDSGVSVEELLMDYNFNKQDITYTDDQKSILKDLLDNRRRTDLFSNLTTEKSPFKLGPCDIVTREHPEKSYKVTHSYPEKESESLKVLPIPFYLYVRHKRKKNQKESGLDYYAGVEYKHVTTAKIF